jgi:hypothetical protein
LGDEVRSRNSQLQFQQTRLSNLYSSNLSRLVVVMSDVELWKASQADAIKKLSSNLACGIFVVCVEIAAQHLVATAIVLSSPHCSTTYPQLAHLFFTMLHREECTGSIHNRRSEPEKPKARQRFRALKRIKFLLSSKKFTAGRPSDE